MKRMLTLILALAVLMTAAGCSGSAQGTENDLMKSIVCNDVEPDAELDAHCAAAADFAVRLFKSSAAEGENTLVSPLSVLCALSMTANGAKGDTLAQMEEVLGLSVPELNAFVHTYTEGLPHGEKHRLSMANSIWFKDDESFSANEDFLQTNADYYGADIYKAPFDDSTLRDINAWVSENTDGMIPEILDRISNNAVMYLVNALAFDAEWQEAYSPHQVREGVFTQEDGTEQRVELMYSEEHAYLEDELASGFIKYHADRAYAFAALLPKDGVTVAQYVDSLTGEGLREMLSQPQGASVMAALPRFESEYSVLMNDVLKSMGMIDAFDEQAADLSGLGSSDVGDNIYINRVIHKTFISVNELGTRAGAATLVEADSEGAAMDVKTVELDRPFVYMLIDCERGLPFFMGTVMSVG